MHYTGTQNVLTHGRPERPTLSALLGIIDRAADQLGVTYTGPAVKRARLAAERAAELRATLAARLTGTDRAAAAQAGRDYLDGDTTAQAVVDTAADAATLAAADTARAARRLVDVAVAAVEAEGVAALQGMTEAEWLDPLRPVVAERVAQAHAEADAVGIDSPRPSRSGVRSHTHPFAPTSTELKQTATRHAWERLHDAIENLHAAFAPADDLRRMGLLPTTPGRGILEDYRWLHPSRLEGRPWELREFWLANRHVAEPGIYTAAEMAEADDSTAPVEAGTPEAEHDGTDEHEAEPAKASA